MAMTLDVSFHTHRMIPLSDVCKRAGYDYITRVTLENMSKEDVAVTCKLEYDLSSLPVRIDPIRAHTSQDVPIPKFLQHTSAYRWMYLLLEAEGTSIKESWDSPNELRMIVSGE
jgi:hypothetical protein